MDKGFMKVRKFDPLKETLIYKKNVLDTKAELALTMIEKWGMVQGYPDGEDSAGRAKIGLMPIDKLIERAFESAEAAFTEIEKRGWLMEVPPPELEKDK